MFCGAPTSGGFLRREKGVSSQISNLDPHSPLREVPLYIEKSFFLSIICSFHSYRPSHSIPRSMKHISPVYSKNFLARCVRSPPIHMMRYRFAGLHLFMIAETHSHRRIPSLPEGVIRGRPGGHVPPLLKIVRPL